MHSGQPWSPSWGVPKLPTKDPTLAYCGTNRSGIGQANIRRFEPLIGVIAGGRSSRFPPERAWSRPSLDPLVGRIRRVGPLVQHRPAEETGLGATVAGVDALAEGHDADLLLGQFRLDVPPFSKFQVNRFRKPPQLHWRVLSELASNSLRVCQRVEPGWVPPGKGPAIQVAV